MPSHLTDKMKEMVERRLDALLVHNDAADEDHEHHNSKY
ncbi:MAG: hypothetical protein OJF50_004691 [Nitrospira sp.]|nr:hypothetical protein [Nitrospira sp.]